MTRSIPSVLLALLVPSLIAANDRNPVPAIQLNQPAKGTVSFDVTGLNGKALEALAKVDWKSEQWNALFAVYVDKGNAKERLPMLGSYSVAGKVLRFEPRFGISAGVKYACEFDSGKLPVDKPVAAFKLQADFAIPKPESKPTTTVSHVYPTASTLPENQLKFYLHFSAPMSKGEAYDRIRILDEKGKEVKDAFLDVGAELWDAESLRFTLIIDPGRIKRGLRPREEIGPVFESGKSYTLVVDAKWADAEGQPLKVPFKKNFKIADPAEKAIDVKTWKLDSPKAETADPLTVRFPAPLDHALISRLPYVIDAEGRRLKGTVTVAKEETVWQFKPDQPWTAGKYELVVPTHLEDLAGNQVGRPFEVDEFRPKPVDPRKDVVKIGFEVK